MRTRAAAFAVVVLLSACVNAGSQSAYTVDAANALVRAQDWNGLLRYATAWTKATPNDAMGWYYLGNAYGIGLKRPDQAQPAFQRAVELRANWPQAWNALGFVSVDLKRYDDAVTAFTHATEQAPTRPNYWNSLAAAYSYQNRLSMAVQALEGEQRALTADSKATEWYNLGNGFLTMEEFKLAANAYRRALALDPADAASWNNLGTLEGVLGNTNAALADYQRASRLGNQLGANNYARLQQTIAAAQQTRSDDPLRALWRSQVADAEYRARQAWQERLAIAQN
ncbi:MAG: tetratricopeptide repeat protein [Acidobacteriota bacterium]